MAPQHRSCHAKACSALTLDGVHYAMGEPGARASFRTVSAWGVEEVATDVAALEQGFHAVVMTFEGELTAVRFRHVQFHEDEPWAGVVEQSLDDSAVVVEDNEEAWSSSLSQVEYQAVVTAIREHIAAGTAYQVNACRVMSQDGPGTDMDGLFADILRHNPAPYASRIDVRGVLDVVSASPELFLERNGQIIGSAPIKGTAGRSEDMLPKDVAENIMITDLVRNDLQRISEPGTVVVDSLLETQMHPGLVHLVSTVKGQLLDGVSWSDIFGGTFPPGSVSGAPKSSALEIIGELERKARGPYCGAIGWIDADSGRAELAVGIRTFWQESVRNEIGSETILSQRLSFGTGAGITWGSDPQGEWEETQLKARRLVALAQRHSSRERS